MTIRGTTKLFGCIAHPTDHVRAPSLFNPQFEANGQDAVMVPIDIHPDRLAEGMAGLQAMPNFKGAAVTIPFKMSIASLCDELGPVAKITGAVNAIRFKDGALLGDNFDGAGFVAGLYGEGHSLADKKCLLIGAGGAAHAIAYALSCEPIADLTIYNRTTEKAHELVDAIKSHNKDASLQVAETLSVGGYDIIIQATPLGLKDGDALPCNPDEISPGTLLCDIIMVPAETALMKAASKRGIACHYGKHMLDYQMALIGAFIGADER